MAARSVWSGALDFGALTMHVEVVSATQKYEGADPVRQVCACHHKPFTRKEECAEGGGQRLTADKLKAGEQGALLAAAVEQSPGVYVALDPSALAGVKAAIESDVIEPEALIERSDIPLAHIEQSYYLRAHRKIANSMALVKVVHALLRDEQKALVGKWSYKGRQHRVAVFVDTNGALTMVKLRYAQETVDPDGEILAPGAQSVEPQMVELLAQALSVLPSNYSLVGEEDESIVEKGKAIKAALAGEAPPTVEAAPEQSAVPDLMAALQAAAANAPKAKKRSTPTKASVRA